MKVFPANQVTQTVAHLDSQFRQAQPCWRFKLLMVAVFYEMAQVLSCRRCYRCVKKIVPVSFDRWHSRIRNENLNPAKYRLAEKENRWTQATSMGWRNAKLYGVHSRRNPAVVQTNCCAAQCRDSIIRRYLEPLRATRLIFLLCGLLLLLAGCAAAEGQQVRRVLIFYESGAYKPLPSLIERGLQTALENSPYQIEFYREFMETARFPDSADQQLFRSFYIQKYRNHRPDVIVAVGPSPLEFMVETQQRAFPGIPVIFCLPNKPHGDVSVGSDFIGVEADIEPAATLAAALQLLPGTKHVVVVGGTSPFDVQQESAVMDELRAYEHRLDISYLTNVSMPDLLHRVQQLPSHTIILLSAIGRDAAGTTFSTDEAGPMIVAAANAPIFTLNDRLLNHGEVGGNVSDAVEQGKVVGNITVRILNGESPHQIPAVRSGSTYVFDWRALKRWGLKEKNLPAGSKVLNRQYTVWQSYKWYIAGGISLMLLEALLISGLIWQRARRRNAERELAMAFEVVQESEQRFRLVANTAPVMIWLSGPDKLCTYVNQTWLDITGRPLEAEIGNGWLERIHPDDMRTCLETYTKSFDRRESFTMQYRLRRSKGDYR